MKKIYFLEVHKAKKPIFLEIHSISFIWFQNTQESKD